MTADILGQQIKQIIAIDPSITKWPTWPRKGERPDRCRKVEILCNILIYHTNSEINKIAADALSRLKHQDAVDKFCDCWATNGDPLLEKILVTNGYIAATSDELHMLTAFKTHRYNTAPLNYGRYDPRSYRSPIFFEEEFSGSLTIENLCFAIQADNYEINLQTKKSSLERLNELLQMPGLAHKILEKKPYLYLYLTPRRLNIIRNKGTIKFNRRILEEAYPHETPKRFSNHVVFNPTMINALIKIYYEGKEPYFNRVKEILGNLRDPDVIEIICDYLILDDYPDPILLNIFREKGYGPKDESKKAMYFFITEQWDNYEKHDFQEDRPLLRQNYAIISDDLRKKVMASARKGGRTAILMKALMGHGKRHKIQEMGHDEWTSIIEYLRKDCRWNDLWKLLLIAPIEWSAEILIILSNAGWKGKEASGLFEQLLNVCPKEGNNLKLIDLQHYMTFTGVSGQLIITHNGRYLIGMDTPGTDIWIRNLRDGAILKKINTGLTLEDYRICLSPNDKILVFYPFPRSTYLSTTLYEMPSGKLIKSIPSDNLFVISKNSKALFTYSGIWQIPEGTLISPYNKDSDRKSKYILTTSDEQILICVRHYDDEIHLWQLPDGAYIKSMEGHRSEITGLAISPDGTTLISSSRDSIRIWRLPKGENISSIKGEYNTQYNCISFNPDGGTASCGRSEGRIQIFGVPEGNILANFKASQGRIRSLQYIHDGKVLISKGSDGTIKCWDLSNYNNFLTFSSDNLFPPVVSPDGKIFAFIDDNKIQVWQLCWIKPLALASYDDLAYVQKVIHERSLDDAERKGWQFLEALLKAKFRFDISLEEKVISLGEYDIEIDT